MTVLYDRITVARDDLSWLRPWRAELLEPERGERAYKPLDGFGPTFRARTREKAIAKARRFARREKERAAAKAAQLPTVVPVEPEPPARPTSPPPKPGDLHRPVDTGSRPATPPPAPRDRRPVPQPGAAPVDFSVFPFQAEQAVQGEVLGGCLNGCRSGAHMPACRHHPSHPLHR